MTFWLDAHLDPELAAWLGSRFGVIAKHLKELALHEKKDHELVAAARRFGKIVVITKDGGFAGATGKAGAPPQILHLEIGNLSTIEIQIFLLSTFPDALKRLEQGEAVVQIKGPQG